MTSVLKNKRVMVTGACGTVGSELIRQLLLNEHYGVQEVIGVDNNESELFFLDQAWLAEPRARFFVADIRDRQELCRRMDGVDIVFHAAAYKHVVLCERSPNEAVQTNIGGVQNVISAATQMGVERVIFTSSDKAVNPTNVMGTSKLMGERLMTAANSSKRGEGPIFASTRFGNVLGSNGSVVPIFHNQIMKGGPVTLTDKEMSRFIMSIESAVKLVIDSAELAKGGEVFITKMPVIAIEGLAKAMINQLATESDSQGREIEIVEIGSKPGEKLYEELMSDEETRRSLELDDYFVVLPAFRGIYHDIEYSYPNHVSDCVTDPYVSKKQEYWTVNRIEEYLSENKLLNTPDSRADQRYWPGDKEAGQTNEIGSKT